MEKSSLELSQPDRLVRMTSEDITNRKWTDEEIQAADRIAARQAAGDDSEINFDDIPEITDEQFAAAVRLRDRKSTVSVNVRLDASVFDWLKSKGDVQLTQVNEILRHAMETEKQSAVRL